MSDTSYGASEGVYPPSEDTFLLVDTAWECREAWMRDLRASVVAEVGTGSGYVLASVAAMLRSEGRKEPLMIACDVNDRACHATRNTIRAHGCESRLSLVVDDLARGFFHGFSRGFAVDLLLCNPPYVPTDEEEVKRDGIARAWAGGARGRCVIDRFVERAGSILAPEGVALLVVLQENDPEEICQGFQAQGMESKIVKTTTADEEKLHVIMARWRSRDVDEIT